MRLELPASIPLSKRHLIAAGALAAVVALAACSTNISGGAKGAGGTAPNVDFYLLLDTSPSMEIAGTSGGIASLEAATKFNEGGCAFGCHQSNSSDMGTFKAADG